MATLTGRLYIDGLDAYANYGMVVTGESLKALLQWPSYKASSIDTNNWHESDGIEANLSSPVLDGRQVRMQFGLMHNGLPSEAQVLLFDLTAAVYHTFNFQMLGKSYTFRLVGNPSFSQNEKFDTLSLTMAEDTVAVPTSTASLLQTFTPSGYTIDDDDFAAYGVSVVQGTRDSFLAFASPKEALKRSISNTAGIIYDSSDTIKYTSKEVKVNLHLRTATVAAFWERWNLLWRDVLASNYRTVTGEGMMFQCYYSKCAVSRFSLLSDGGVWCDFSISFAVLAYNRGNEWTYLAWQDDAPVLFEDDNPSHPTYYVRIN